MVERVVAELVSIAREAGEAAIVSGASDVAPDDEERRADAFFIEERLEARQGALVDRAAALRMLRVPQPMDIRVAGDLVQIDGERSELHQPLMRMATKSFAMFLRTRRDRFREPLGFDFGFSRDGA